MKSRLSQIFFFVFLLFWIVYPLVNTFAQYFPNQFPGLQLWLRSDSAVTLSGNNVLQWNDCSGNSHIAVQNNASNQPTFIADELNHLPGIKFNGSSTVLNGDTINGLDTSSATVIILASGDLVTPSYSFRGYFSIGNLQFGLSYDGVLQNIAFLGGGSYTWYATGAPLPNTGYGPKVLMVKKKNGIDVEQFINNALNYTDPSLVLNGSFTNGPFEIGHATNPWGGYHKGNIFEVLVYDKYLPDSVSNKVFLYLSQKYGGGPVNLGADLLMNDFCPTVLHAGTQFVHYLWNTGDTTESITVNSNGSYHVRVTDIFGGVSYDTVQLTYPVITLHDTLMCALDSVTLSTGLPSGFNYQWSSGQTTPSITVSDTGLYFVTASKNFCSKTSDTIHITKDLFPIQASLGNDTSICSGNSIGLTHPYPLPPSLLYNWSTGDTTSTISLTNSGTYFVTVTNSIGCVARDTILVTINGIAPSINFLNSSACSGDTVYFTNVSSPIGDSWIWDFGDGNTSNLENPSYMYAFGGSYQVKLKVTSGNCSNELTKTIIIHSKPQAHFSISTACIGNPYSFIDQSTTSAGDTIVSYDWDFGDGTLHSSIKNPFHIYSSSGNYGVVLNITTDKGCGNSFSDTITVVSTSPPPSQLTLNFPQQNAEVSSHIITFEWYNAANTEKYALEYSSSQFFTNKTRIFPLITNQYQTHVNAAGNVFWHVIAYNLCNDSTVSEERKFKIFLPNQVQGLQLWLRSDSAVTLSGNNVSQWNDCSGNLHHVVQNIPSNQPILIADELNHLPGIKFNGSSTVLNGDTINGLDTSSATVIILASGDLVTSSYAFRGYFSIGDLQFGLSYDGVLQNIAFLGGGSYTWPPGTPLPNTGYGPKVLMVKKKTGVDVEQFINNALNFINPSSLLNDSFTNGPFEIGHATNNWSGYHKGNIFEVLVYNKYLPDSVSTNVFRYFTDKYAPAVNLGRDIDIPYGLCVTSLDAGARFTHFTWSTGDTTQIINISQSGDYSVTVSNIFNELSTDTIHVNMPSIILPDTAFCLGDTINISANMGAGYSYLWFPDSVTSNNLSVFQPGNYSLTLFDTNNCSRTTSFTVVADSFAVIASLGPDRKICKGDYIGLVNGAQQAMSYLWSDGTGNSLLTINDALGSNPNYSVTVSSNNGCNAIDTIHLKVNGLKPNVAFASDSVCFGNYSHFTNMSSVDPPSHIVDYKWNFGDASFSTVTDPDYLYVDDGYFQVTLTATTDSGCINSLLNTAVVFSKPLVNFLPYQGCSGVPISFTDKTQCLVGSLTHWDWKFNDTTNSGFDTSTMQNPQYIFDSAGDYNIKLIAASNAGCIDSIEKIVIIKKSPSLDFSISSACAEHNVYFHDIINLQPWETIISYNWQFGDGNSAVISNPSHVFDTAGIYTTIFTAKTSTGCNVSITKPIDVGGIPQVDFVYGNNCILNTTQFSDNSLITNGNINWWHWNFGGLGSSGNQNPMFIFPDTAVYNVSLTVKTDHNCEDSMTYPVEIVAAPMARFSLSPEYGVPPLPVTMVNTSIGATTYLWSFGDTESSALTNPVHTYENQGIFNVLLSAYNAIGCSDTVSAMVYVLPTTVNIAVINATLSQDNGRLFVAADLLNEGTRRIDHIDMAVDFGNGNILHEQWLGSLPEGEGLHYEFTASSEVSTNGDLNFVCVKATLPELTEDSTNNNIFCVALKDEFLIPDIYPNPVKDMINITYILPFEDQVTIDLVNSMGSYIQEIYSGGGKEGYNHLITDVSKLNSGVYTIRISFRDKVLRKKFVKL